MGSSPGLARRHTHDPEKRVDGDMDAPLEDGVALGCCVTDLDPRVSVGDLRTRPEQPEVRHERGPPPVCCLKVEHFDLQRVAGFGTTHKDRPEDRVGLADVEFGDGVHVGEFGDLAVGAVEGVECHDIARIDRGDG